LSTNVNIKKLNLKGILKQGDNQLNIIFPSITGEEKLKLEYFNCANGRYQYGDNPLYSIKYANDTDRNNFPDGILDFRGFNINTKEHLNF